MPAKMISDTPLPMPRSVTCSPTHIRKMVPAVNATMAVNTKPMPGAYTTGAPPGDTWFCSASAILPPCTTARSTAPMREYCVILRRPDSPSFCMAFRAGKMCTASCITMDAEIYGITFNAKMLKRCRAPPENMLNMSTIPPPCACISASMASGLTPGTGT